MSKFFRTKYRIVTDCGQGYEAQFKIWCWPFWIQCFGANTSPTIDRARYLIKIHCRRLVEFVDPYKESVNDN